MAAFIDSTFASYEEFEEKFNLFKVENSVTFRKKTSETVAKANAKTVAEIPPHFVYSRVEFTCTHFGQPKYRGNGVKSKTKHTATGCETKFVLKYDYYEKVLRISKAHLEHNHPTTPETYSQEYQVKRLTQTQRKTLKEIVDLNPQNEKLMRLVNAKFNKAFTLSEIRRLKHQCKSFVYAGDRVVDGDEVVGDRGAGGDEIVGDRGAGEDEVEGDRGVVGDEVLGDRGVDREEVVEDRGAGGEEVVGDRGAGGERGVGTDEVVGDRGTGGEEIVPDEVVGDRGVSGDGRVGEGGTGAASLTLEDVRHLNVTVPNVHKRGRPKQLKTSSGKKAKKVGFNSDVCYVCFDEEVRREMCTDGYLMDWVGCSRCPRWYHNVCIDVVSPMEDWVCMFCCQQV